ncbi:toxin YdaT family protein [Rouxiella badensis]|uniref:toxin YdaT family protein n=1 Tax=Rouxiella badensis TaxID=1646377 RepID=UPI00301DC21F
MENMEKLKDEVMAWAFEKGQEYVAIEISRIWLGSNTHSKSIRLYPMEDEFGHANPLAIHNNKQQIFRWIRGDTKVSQAKVLELADAMFTSLPAERKARINGETLNCQISALLHAISKTVTAALLKDDELEKHIRNAHHSLVLLRTVSAQQKQRCSEIWQAGGQQKLLRKEYPK